jgi:hypothetical protein
MPTPSHQVEFILYAEETALIVVSHKPMLFERYLESNLSDLKRWLSEWRIAINVSNNSAMIFVLAKWRFIQPRSITNFVQPLQWVDTTRHLEGDPRQTTYLVAYYRSGKEEYCSKNGFAGSSPEQ